MTTDIDHPRHALRLVTGVLVGSSQMFAAVLQALPPELRSALAVLVLEAVFFGITWLRARRREIDKVSSTP